MFPSPQHLVAFPLGTRQHKPCKQCNGRVATSHSSSHAAVREGQMLVGMSAAGSEDDSWIAAALKTGAASPMTGLESSERKVLFFSQAQNAKCSLFFLKPRTQRQEKKGDIRWEPSGSPLLRPCSTPFRQSFPGCPAPAASRHAASP